MYLLDLESRSFACARVMQAERACMGERSRPLRYRTAQPSVWHCRGVDQVHHPRSLAKDAGRMDLAWHSRPPAGAPSGPSTTQLTSFPSPPSIAQATPIHSLFPLSAMRAIFPRSPRETLHNTAGRSAVRAATMPGRLCVCVCVCVTTWHVLRTASLLILPRHEVVVLGVSGLGLSGEGGGGRPLLTQTSSRRTGRQGNQVGPTEYPHIKKPSQAKPIHHPLLIRQLGGKGLGCGRNPR